MIDTTKAKLDARLKPVPIGWTITTKKSQAGGIKEPCVEHSFTMLYHKQTGVRVGVCGGRAVFIEGEMIRLLGRPRGCLLQTQADIDTALARLTELAHAVCEVEEDEPLQLLRLDLCAHVPIAPFMLIRLYRGFKLPKIRALPVCYPDQTLFWPGRPRKVRLYDQQKKLTKEPGSYSRIEIQLNGGGILAEFDRALTTHDLDIERCYAVLRSLILDFQPKCQLPASRWDTIVAMALLENWSYQGVSFPEILKEGVHPKTYVRTMRQAATAAKNLESEPINLIRFFPENLEDYRAFNFPNL